MTAAGYDRHHVEATGLTPCWRGLARFPSLLGAALFACFVRVARRRPTSTANGQRPRQSATANDSTCENAATVPAPVPVRPTPDLQPYRPLLLRPILSGSLGHPLARLSTSSPVIVQGNTPKTYCPPTKNSLAEKIFIIDRFNTVWTTSAFPATRLQGWPPMRPAQNFSEIVMFLSYDKLASGEAMNQYHTWVLYFFPQVTSEFEE